MRVSQHRSGVRVGQVTFCAWESLQLNGGWSDTFIFPMAATDGLPPKAYAQVLRNITFPLLQLRRRASIWVPIESPSSGNWFINEVCYALRGLPAPVAVTRGWVPPVFDDFSFAPWLERCPYPPPPEYAFPDLTVLPENEMMCLRVLRRVEAATTIEVASLAGMSIPTARKALLALAEHGLVRQKNNDALHPVWVIEYKGKSVALRSWGIPAGRPFSAERSLTDGRHRRTSRLWFAWLRKAYPHAGIWACWSEVALGNRLYPDSLAWGEFDGCETLFWLEVESGHSSREKVRQKTTRRFNQAIVYTRRFSGMKLVFVLLSPRWVRKAAAHVFQNVPVDSAVILADWMKFGQLPLPLWGGVRSTEPAMVQLRLRV